MKVKVPKISWHECNAVFSVDIQPKTADGVLRVATSGVDKNVLLWALNVNHIDDEPDVGDVDKVDLKKALARSASSTNKYKFVEFLSALSRHTYPVSIVRWSPSGEFLASGGVDGDVVIWKKNESTAPDIFGEEGLDNKENWTGITTLRGHLDDVSDLSWSPDGKNLITGSVDNSAIVWDVEKGRSVYVLRDHKSFVQGVCWDPLNQWLVTASTDRTCRVYNAKTRQCVSVVHKKQTTENLEEGKKAGTVNLFHDDSVMGFFRRVTFSADGELFFCPAGCAEDGSKIQCVTHAFSRHNLSKPVFSIPYENTSIAVRCNPIKYQLRGKTRIMDCSYSMIYAVACVDCVTLYSTQQTRPIAMFKDLHYDKLSDMSWSSDGLVLIVSSTDGYCTIICFEKGELGVPYLGKPAAVNVDQETRCQVSAAPKMQVQPLIETVVSS